MVRITKAEIEELVEYYGGTTALGAKMLVHETTVRRWLNGMKPHRSQRQRLARLLERKRRAA